jgi:CheY-like chemotaxis protein
LLEEKRPEVLVLSTRPAVTAHVRALLEPDVFLVTEARDVAHALDLVRASRARTLLLLYPGAEAAPLRAEVAARRPDIDILSVGKPGNALLDGALGRQRAIAFATDALHLLASTIERATNGPPVADRATQLAELTCRKLGLSRAHTEASVATTILWALAPHLIRFMAGVEVAPAVEGGESLAMRAARAAAASLRAPWDLDLFLRNVEERWDGRGRPAGAAGEKIPLPARLAAVIVEWVASSEGAADKGAVVQRLGTQAGKDWDPKIVDALVRVVRDADYVQRISQDARGPVAAVVDGDPAASALAELRLAAAGFSVKTFTDGRAAEEALAATPPDVVVSEVVLPRYDGLSLLLKLRRTPATKAVPFFFVTSTADKATAAKALKLGATDVVAKPPSWDVLVVKLRDAASKARPAQPAAAPQAGAVEGDLAEMALTDLVQVLAFGRRTATILVSNGALTGSISLDRGEPAAASLGSASGLEAFCAMAILRKGKFRVDTKAPPQESNLASFNLEGLLLEAMRRMDEIDKPPPKT